MLVVSAQSPKVDVYDDPFPAVIVVRQRHWLRARSGAIWCAC